MRILQVLPRYAPAWAFGGGVRMFWILAEALASRGHQVSVITSDSLSPDTRSTDLTETLGAGVRVRRYRNRYNGLSAALGPIFFRPIGMRAALRRAVLDVDVIHMGESRGIHNVWTADAAATAKVPLIWSAYGGLASGAGIRGLYRQLHDDAFTKKVLPHVAAVVAQTPHEEEVYLQFGLRPEQIERIPLCLDPELESAVVSSGSFRRMISVPHGAPLVVSVARLHPVKGLDLLIRAFAQLPVGGNPPYLALVGGDHGAQEALMRQAESLGVAARVKFPGPLYGSDRFAAYSDATVFALTPAVFEETSLAALEAAACGAPTVLIRECEIPGLADTGGGLVVPREEAAVAYGLSSLLGDNVGRQEMSLKARAFTLEHYSARKVVSSHEVLFERLISACAPASSLGF